jgi:hypothetical protein
VDQEPFGYPVQKYLTVAALAAAAASLRYVNQMHRFSLTRLIVEAISGGFTGILTFWLCESSGIHGPLSGFLIGVSGLMGSHAWQEFANVLRIKFGLYHERSEPPHINPSELEHFDSVSTKHKVEDDV